jgi:hypothetical protein
MKKKLLIVVAGFGLVVGLHVALKPGRGRAQEPAGPAGAAPGTRPAAQADPNQDLLVTPAQGQWFICVASYTGPEAPAMARQMALELRGPNYHLPTFVFNYGAEAKRKEEERVRALKAQQIEMLKQFNVQTPTKIYVRTMHIEEQCAVLVGGYPDMEAGRKALDDLRKKCDPQKLLQRVKLNTRVFINPDGTKGELHSVNPFQSAFVVRNPALPPEKVDDREKLDINVLRRLNSGECYSLLNCPKPLTLAVAQFCLPAALQKERKGSTFWDKVGLGDSHDNGDPAAIPAHSLAEGLRKGNIEAYVLHTKYGSIVTVGGYDSLQDPKLKLARERLTAWGVQMSRQCPMLTLLPQPMPMEVPR